MDLWTPHRRQKEVKDIFVSHCVGLLAGSLNLSPQDMKLADLPSRFDVFPDTLIYNRNEDPYVFDQAKGKVPEYFTVYFDGVYICGFGTDEPQERIDFQFWKGISEAYKSNKIRFNKGLAEKMRLEQEQQILEAKLETDKRIDALPESTPTQKMAKQVIRKVKNGRLQKKNKSSTTAT